MPINPISQAYEQGYYAGLKGLTEAFAGQAHYSICYARGYKDGDKSRNRMLRMSFLND